MEQVIKIKKKKKKRVLPQERLTRSAINIIRTTQRNNIDLKNIADNKANILLSVNALMITFLIPIILSNLDVIYANHYHIPLIFLGLTCFVTLIFSALVLLPFSERGRSFKDLSKFRELSPFFFENYEKMSVDKYYEYFCETVDDGELFSKCIVEDLHYYGRIISLKYKQIKMAYITFIAGICITALATLITMIT